MGAGKRYKFTGSEIQFMTEADEVSPGPLGVSAITNADPAVVTMSSTASLGVALDVIVGKLTSVEGMTEVDDELFLAQIIDGTTVRLLNIDSTGYGTFTGTALWNPGTMSNWCEVTAFNRQGGSAKEIDASTVCSEAEEIELDLPAFGSVQIDFNYAPATNVQQALDTFDQSKEKTALHYTLPRSGGERWVLGFVQQTGEQGSRGNLWTGSATFRITGLPVTVVP